MILNNIIAVNRDNQFSPMILSDISKYLHTNTTYEENT